MLALSGVMRYSQTGCTVFEAYIQTQLPGAIARDIWDLHCRFGEFHCATATVRSFPVHPTWNKIGPSGFPVGDQVRQRDKVPAFAPVLWFVSIWGRRHAEA
jgi:hypothetical protein